jgi:hypothetical protein
MPRIIDHGTTGVILMTHTLAFDIATSVISKITCLQRLTLISSQ